MKLRKHPGERFTVRILTNLRAEWLDNMGAPVIMAEATFDNAARDYWTTEWVDALRRMHLRHDLGELWFIKALKRVASKPVDERKPFVTGLDTVMRLSGEHAMSIMLDGEDIHEVPSMNLEAIGC